MGEFEFDDDIDFDACAELEWGALAERLEGRLATLKREEFVEIARTDLGGHRPILAFTRTGSGRLRCTVSGSAFPVCFTSDEYRAMRARYTSLVDLGWRELRNGTTIHEVGKRSVGELVSAVVRALREVWEIEDRSVLDVHDPFGPKFEKPTMPTPRETENLSRERVSFGVVPRDAAHLLEMARRTLAEDSCDTVEIDDNAIRFMTLDGVYSKLLVSPQATRLEFCTILAHGTPDMDLLGAVVAEHSSRWPEISVVVTKGHVFGVRAVEASVYHSANLLSALAAWLEYCHDGSIDIVEQFHPEVVAHEDFSPDDLPGGLTKLMADFAEDPKTTPEAITRSCRANAPMLRRYARICSKLIEERLAMEEYAISHDYPDSQVERCRQKRMEIEQFWSVLLDAISLAAEHNVAWNG
ncbi:TY-Chap domain-containing protein [Williamsia soli]|uniref:TY-Chap domain-containing protein n=1 Tax=Williamsia soli TaxID=364929 RepID=UPI001A9DB4C4|nr:hypothetical protein [Williamsia soli]